MIKEKLNFLYLCQTMVSLLLASVIVFFCVLVFEVWFGFLITLSSVTDKLEYPEMTADLLQFTDKLHHIKLYRIHIHVIELLCYNWRFANLWLEIWSHNWRFFIDVFDACFYCLLMFSFCLFQY